MKLVIMQYGKMIPGVAYENLEEIWQEKIQDLPVPIEYTLLRDDGQYIGQALDEILEDADALLGLRIQKGTLTESFWKKHPKLKYIGMLSHAYGEFDKALSRKYGVTITNTVYGVPTISEYTWAMILALMGEEPLADKVLGVVGQGAIGRRVAAIGESFGMQVRVWDPLRCPNPAQLEELFHSADVIALNCRVMSETEHMINADSIRRMKDGVVIVNTARGNLIEEATLQIGLSNRKIKAAGLDVFEQEPPKQVSALMENPYCMTTGHIGWMTSEAVYRTIEIGIMNFLSYLRGQKVSVINEEREDDNQPY